MLLGTSFICQYICGIFLAERKIVFQHSQLIKNTSARENFKRYVYIKNRITQSGSDHRSECTSRRHLQSCWKHLTNCAAAKHKTPCACHNKITLSFYYKTRIDAKTSSRYVRRSWNHQQCTRPAVLYSFQYLFWSTGPATEAYVHRPVWTLSSRYTSCWI